MNLTETAKLLTVASTIDNRTVGNETVIAWHQILGYLDYPTAEAAVFRHFGESHDYLKPKHIKDQARRIRDGQARQQRMSRPALEPPRITLNRAEFERQTQAAIEQARRERAHG